MIQSARGNTFPYLLLLLYFGFTGELDSILSTTSGYAILEVEVVRKGGINGEFHGEFVRGDSIEKVE